MTSIGISQTLPERVDFNIHIRPILSDRCFKCHGPDANKREGNLRLDIADSAYAELIEHKGQFAIVPGNIHTSVLLKRIKSVDSALIMPPSDSKLKLSSFEIALLEKWIKQGAEYKQHWAFIAPSLPNVPLQKHKWPANDIDRFVLAKMMQQQLNPNGTSDKERLLKRLSMDLIGLPSTLELQDQFLADTTDRGYEKIVDTLLNNPHYGERMALNWLDVARYADSHGYQDDGIRSMWPWRDWVIFAFNQNYSYQQFVSWQIAGDLLPNPTKEMLLATGFNRNHKITEEAGVIDEEYRLEYVTDRTNTFAKTFLAMTFECAKCHDHKYDPIPQKSYFSTFAFFNQVPETGLLTDPFGILYADAPKMKITSEEVTSLLKFINKKDTAAVEVMIMQDSTALRPTHILLRGVYDQLGEVVTASTPTQIFPFDTNQFKQNRLGLAQWLFDKNHPLTARVYVNRIWAQFFGRGLVPTTSDFGMQGEMPTHPELLDWLALDFMNHGWNIKRLVKMIVMSSTYRQSAEINVRKQSQDPDNIYLSRYRRVRIPALFLPRAEQGEGGRGGHRSPNFEHKAGKRSRQAVARS